MPIQRITSGILADGAIVATDIADGSVTTAKIADGNVTAAKVSTIANTQLTGTITSAQLGTGAVSNTKIASGAVEQYFADTGYEAQFRNRIINGDMRIDQRNAGASATNTGATTYYLDRWVTLGTTSAGQFSVQQDSDAPAGFSNSAKITVTTIDSSLAATDRYTWGQRIEGYTVSDFDFGKASAKTITLSFYVRSSVTGTFGAGILNGDSTRSYPFNYTISAADTWEYKTITIPGDTSGTWPTNSDRAMIVRWVLGVGSDREGTANTWAAGNFYSTSGSTNLMATLNATWYITGVQLEVGSVATPFERRPYGTELSLCQRYYTKITVNDANDSFGVALCNTTTEALGDVFFPTTMRVSPTALEQTGTAADYEVRKGGSTITCSAVPTYVRATQYSSSVGFPVSSGLTAGDAALIRAATTSAFLAWSAEL